MTNDIEFDGITFIAWLTLFIWYKKAKTAHQWFALIVDHLPLIAVGFGLWIISCEDANHLAYGTLVVILRNLLLPERKHERTHEVLTGKSPYDLNTLMWLMLHSRLIVCAKLKVKVSVYFVTFLFIFILNIVSTKLWHKIEYRHIWPPGNIKSGAVYFLYFDNFYSLILTDNIVI